MELRVSRTQFDAIRAARHLPDALKKVLDAAAPAPGGDGLVLGLTYEEAVALNELCSWNVHTDDAGRVTAESRVFDEVVRAILTHPDY